ncbi:hypothetical protein [Methylobacterium sp. E-045]|uniref:hypothetical protein n=1 Tax=Methylobacterium sp. E-045 TaxID=2836575 RepID=UPI00391D3998
MTGSKKTEQESSLLERIVLERVCDDCGGEGRIQYTGTCPFCDGGGYIPTEDGEKILALVFHSRLGRRPRDD